MARLDRPAKQRFLAMIFSFWSGLLSGIYVEHALRQQWAPETALSMRLLVSAAVTTAMTGMLFWLIGRVGKSHR